MTISLFKQVLFDKSRNFQFYRYCRGLLLLNIGFIAQMSAYITLLLWSPRAEEYAVAFVLAALFGIGASINSPMVSGKVIFKSLNTFIKL